MRSQAQLREEGSSQKERSSEECLIGRLRGEINGPSLHRPYDRPTDVPGYFHHWPLGTAARLTRIPVVVLDGGGGNSGSGGGGLGHGRGKVDHLEVFDGVVNHVKGPYLNDVYKIFWFFDPSPPLSTFV